MFMCFRPALTEISDVKKTTQNGRNNYYVGGATDTSVLFSYPVSTSNDMGNRRVSVETQRHALRLSLYLDTTSLSSNQSRHGFLAGARMRLQNGIPVYFEMNTLEHVAAYGQRRGNPLTSLERRANLQRPIEQLIRYISTGNKTE